MNYRTLGKTGYKISDIGFGAWAIGGSSWGPQSDSDSIRALHRAIDNGVNFIDTAQGYGDGHSERLIAKVLKEREETVYVATKTPAKAPGHWPPAAHERWQDRYPEDYLRENVESRLKNLGVERLDLLQLHTWTRAWNADPQPFETLAALKKEGKIGAIGVSTPEPDQNAVIDLMKGGWVDTVQVIYNIFDQHPAAGILPVALQENVGIIVRVALEKGALTGKFTYDTQFPKGDGRSHYFGGTRLKRVVDRVEKIREEFKDTHYSMAELAMRFVLDHPAVTTVIAGMRNERQVELNTPVSDLSPLPKERRADLFKHEWHRQFWFSQ